MNIASRFSIKNRTYLLVLLSVAVALILSLVSNNGLNAIRVELNDLILATKIERYTTKIILEEQNYRLNANGSVSDFSAANHAYENTIRHIEGIYQTLNEIENLERNDLLLADLKKTRQSTEEYKTLYLRGVSLLTELNNQANILETEGENITLNIQQYVESKRLEIKKHMNKKTVEKINNGSNIWQYTYVTRLHEKKYRLSPSDEVFDSFKKDYQFMQSEWLRLEGLSDQDSEFEKLMKFNIAAKKYEAAMLLWVDLNKQLVTDVLPQMNYLGGSVIISAIQSAKRSIKYVEEKRNNIAITLLAVSVLTIILGIVFGSLIAKSISTAVSSFQSGLLNFFEYLNQKQKTAQPIVVQGNDEISVMAEVVNKNIVNIQSLLNRKTNYQNALLEWFKVDYLDDNITINKATELSAKALNVERVSIWFLMTTKQF